MKPARFPRGPLQPDPDEVRQVSINWAGRSVKAETVTVVGYNPNGDAMNDLIEFLLARIAEDERYAQAAIGGARPDWVVGSEETSDGENAFWSVEALGESSEWFAGLGSQSSDHARAEHMARHDPARVLAECEAKREIVEADARRRIYTSEVANARIAFVGDGVIEVGDERMSVAEFDRRYTVPAEPSEHVRLLALPYADHPDYRGEWRL